MMLAYVLKNKKTGALFCTSLSYGGYTKNPRIYVEEKTAKGVRLLMKDLWMRFGFESAAEWQEQQVIFGLNDYSATAYMHRRSFVDALQRDAKENPYWDVVPISAA